MPWFLTEGKLAAVLIKPSSWGSQLDGDLYYHTPPQQPPPCKVFENGYFAMISLWDNKKRPKHGDSIFSRE
jgi:hypothetical protein